VSTASLVIHQARYDLRTFFRDPRARGLTLAVPVIMLVFFGSVFKHDSFTYSGTSIMGSYYYLPRMIVLGVMGVAVSNMVITLVAERESGALKRRRATPVRPIALIGGDVVTCEVSALTIAAVLVVIGWLAFGVHLHGAAIPVMLLTAVIGTAALCSIAYALSPFLKSVDATGPVVMIVTIVLNIISGIYVPENIFPAWLRDVAQILPLRPFALAMQAAVDPGTNHGHIFAWTDLAIVVAWGAGACLIAIWKFTWSPSQQ
jgi:ABC-2 type transport system permease protein